MRNTRKEDLRVQKTMDSIHEAFEKMICEMDYEKITVKELSERARINKKTFYRYYSALDDLLSEMQDDMSKEYIERISAYEIPRDLDKIIREFFLYSEEKGAAYERITCSSSYHYIRQTMIENVINHTLRQVDRLKQYDIYRQNIFIAYITTSILEIYKQWVADGKKIPLDEIIAITIQLLCQGVYSFIENVLPV